MGETANTREWHATYSGVNMATVTKTTTSYSLYPAMYALSPPSNQCKLSSSTNLPRTSDWPEPLKITKRSPITQNLILKNLPLTPPASPQFGPTLINGMEERPARRDLEPPRAAEGLSPSRQYMHLAPQPVEDDDETSRSQRRQHRVERRVQSAAHPPTRKPVPCTVLYRTDLSSSARIPQLQPTESRSIRDRRVMTTPVLRSHLQQIPPDCSVAAPHRTSNSSSISLGNRSSTSSTATGYRSPGTTATSPASSISSKASPTTRLPPNSADKWIPVVQAQLQSSTVSAHPPVANTAQRLPPNSAERWKPVVHAQLLQQQPQFIVPEPLPRVPSRNATKQATPQPSRRPSLTSLMTQVLPVANTSSIRKTSISAPFSTPITDQRKLSGSWTCSPPLNPSTEFTCPRRSPTPQEVKTTECVSYWSDDDDDDETLPIMQRLMVRGRRGSSAEKERSGGRERSLSRTRAVSKGWGAWVGWN